MGSRPKEISTILRNIFPHVDLTNKLKEYAIKKSWARTVGENIARRARPRRLIDRTLHLTVSSSPWMTELKYLKGDLIAKVNKRLGEELVTDIIFKLGNFSTPTSKLPVKELGELRELTDSEKEFIEETVSKIKDEGLKETVRRAMGKQRALM